jgi:hypothetical protein
MIKINLLARKMIRNEEQIQRRALALMSHLSPFFSPDHITWGHGTFSSKVAQEITQKGLYAMMPIVASTCRSLELSVPDMKTILNWPHKQSKVIVFVLLPRNMKRSVNSLSREEHLFENVTPKENRLEPHKLPAKYIIGFYDVGNDQLIMNPLFEAEPQMPPPIIQPVPRLGRAKTHLEIVTLSVHSDNIPDVW